MNRVGPHIGAFPRGASLARCRESPARARPSDSTAPPHLVWRRGGVTDAGAQLPSSLKFFSHPVTVAFSTSRSACVQLAKGVPVLGAE
jgi:hypothetical protein